MLLAQSSCESGSYSLAILATFLLTVCQLFSWRAFWGSTGSGHSLPTLPCVQVTLHSHDAMSAGTLKLSRLQNTPQSAVAIHLACQSLQEACAQLCRLAGAEIEM